MSFGTPATPEQIKHFKSAAAGLSGRTAGDAIVKSILDEFWYSTGIPPTTPKSTEAVNALRHWIGRIA
jgi:hypothetical protein